MSTPLRGQVEELPAVHSRKAGPLPSVAISSTLNTFHFHLGAVSVFQDGRTSAEDKGLFCTFLLEHPKNQQIC